MKRIRELVRILRERYNWVNIGWLTVMHTGGALGIVWSIYHSEWRTIVLGAALYLFSGLSITAGYHRLFTHGAYVAHKGVQAIYLFFGAAAFQNPVPQWAAAHRRHHRHTDTDKDPYNFRRGFWHAHFLWLIRRPVVAFNPESVHISDLMANRLVRFQYRFYVPLAVFAGLVLPMLLASWWGDPVGGLLVAGFLRLILQSHSTYCVNSLAHYVGARPYTRMISSVDNLVVALITLGEGWHNGHHRFDADYRCGFEWYQFDPGKWLIKTLAWLGLARDLVVTDKQTLAAARAEVQAMQS